MWHGRGDQAGLLDGAVGGEGGRGGPVADVQSQRREAVSFFPHVCSFRIGTVLKALAEIRTNLYQACREISRFTQAEPLWK